MSTGHVTIVGAGIVGVSSALWLQRAGFQVTIVEAGAVGEGASFGNAGNISPGAVVPYMIPGVLKEAPGWLFKPGGPLAVRPGYFFKVLPWLRKTDKKKAQTVEAAIKLSKAAYPGIKGRGKVDPARFLASASAVEFALAGL